MAFSMARPTTNYLIFEWLCLAAIRPSARGEPEFLDTPHIGQTWPVRRLLVHFASRSRRVVTASRSTYFRACALVRPMQFVADWPTAIENSGDKTEANR